MVERRIPNSKIDYLNKDFHDFRSYHLDFSHFQELAPESAPKYSTQNTINEIKKELTASPDFFRISKKNIALDFLIDSCFRSNDWL